MNPDPVAFSNQGNVSSIKYMLAAIAGTHVMFDVILAGG
jgi:hypothetical protein